MLPMKKEKQKKPQYIKLANTDGKVKKFDTKLHDKYDIDARNMIKNVLKDKIKDNENIYGEDMMFDIESFPYKYMEIQVFSKWDSDVFPYTYPFVYARKMKFSKKTLFVTFNKYLSELILFGRNDISDKSTRLKKYDRELIHYVSWGKTLKIKTNQLTIRLIREFYGEFVDTESNEEIVTSTISDE
jgi:hypothetical protein